MARWWVPRGAAFPRAFNKRGHECGRLGAVRHRTCSMPFCVRRKHTRTAAETLADLLVAIGIYSCWGTVPGLASGWRGGFDVLDLSALSPRTIVVPLGVLHSMHVRECQGVPAATSCLPCTVWCTAFGVDRDVCQVGGSGIRERRGSSCQGGPPPGSLGTKWLRSCYVWRMVVLSCPCTSSTCASEQGLDVGLFALARPRLLAVDRCCCFCWYQPTMCAFATGKRPRHGAAGRHFVGRRMQDTVAHISAHAPARSIKQRVVNFHPRDDGTEVERGNQESMPVVQGGAQGMHSRWSSTWGVP